MKALAKSRFRLLNGYSTGRFKHDVGQNNSSLLEPEILKIVTKARIKNC